MDVVELRRGKRGGGEGNNGAVEDEEKKEKKGGIVGKPGVAINTISHVLPLLA